nr:polysaccharide lyase family 7 protein [Pseudocolwellia agarivorans]
MMRFNKIKQVFSHLIVLPISISLITACAQSDVTAPDVPQSKTQLVPADQFDLSHWKMNVPVDLNNDKKIDEISVEEMQTYFHPDFFYLDANGNMVFAAPNKAITTANSTNTRSELRQMLRGSNSKIKTKAPANNFVIAAHPLSEKFAAIGGKMEATLKVDHVALRAKNPLTPAAFSVVVGQIHAGKDKELMKQNSGFGWGNEPIKIYYKKWPGHEKGSVFWNYERNLPKTDKNRTDISYPIWGNLWTNTEDPKDTGIALGEAFSYTINVFENTMHLTFTAENKPTVNFTINLANNLDAVGKVDSKDHPLGYTEDWLYFKAGAYNQCSTKDAPGMWYAGCLGTGDWKTDKNNGDYTQVTFSKLVLSEADKL